MADTTYYLWSDIPLERNEWGQVTKSVKRGDKVTQTQLGVSDADWQDLIDGGVVREYGLPEDMPENYAGSPSDWVKDKNNRLLTATAEGVLSVEEVNTGSTEPSPSYSEKSDKADPAKEQAKV